MTTTQTRPNHFDTEGRKARVCKQASCEFHGIVVRTSLVNCIGNQCGQELALDQWRTLLDGMGFSPAGPGGFFR